MFDLLRGSLKQDWCAVWLRATNEKGERITEMELEKITSKFFFHFSNIPSLASRNSKELHVHLSLSDCLLRVSKLVTAMKLEKMTHKDAYNLLEKETVRNRMFNHKSTHSKNKYLIWKSILH